MLDFPEFAALMPLALTMAAAGALTGVLAGLFGIGGGAILVPILMEFLRIQGVATEYQAHIAVGTSLAIIIPTSIRSFRSHLDHGAPDVDLLKAWAILVPVGVIAASFIAASVSGDVLKGVFAVVALLIAVKMLFNRKSWSLGHDLPKNPTRGAVGFGIGFVSTFMGIGGGNLNNVFMTSFGRPIHQAVATSAGLGVLISIPGAIGYIIAGWGIEGLPPMSLGYVNLLALLLITPVSILTAPLGVQLAHALTKRNMEIAFGVFLLIVAARFLWSIFAG